MSAAPDPQARRAPAFDLVADDDAAFAARAPQIADYLHVNFPGLVGLRQHRPHFDPERDRTTDPVEHTLEMIALLDTHDLDPADALILRASAVFHDIGKLLDPFNIYHAVDSAIICAPYLPDFGLDPATCADVTTVIRNHDVLGRLARYWITAQEGADLFGTRRLAVLTERLTVADIGSIRGLGEVLPSIAAAYAAVNRIYDWREANVRPPVTPPTESPAFRWPVEPRAHLHLVGAGRAGVTGEQIALLEAIERTGSLTAAAAECGIGVATARRTVRAIEREFGAALVIGRGRGSALTPEAHDLLRRWRIFAAGLDIWVREHFRTAFGEV